MMRLLLGFMAAAPSLVLGQLYRPMPEENAGWVEGHSWLAPNALNWNCMYYTQFTCTRTIRFGPDTIIDGLSYHSLYRYGSCYYFMIDAPPLVPGCPYSGTYIEPTAVLGYMRQDTANKLVFWREPDASNEFLLYDFNMGLGPYPVTYNNPSWCTVTAIDSVLLTDGYHKRWLLDIPNANNPEFVIEGIGSSFGLMNYMYIGIESGTWLQCFARNDSLVYGGTSPGTGSCDLDVGVDHSMLPSAKKLLLSPNPGTTHFNLDLPPGPHTITLFDATGRVVLEQRTAEERPVIGTETLASGLYRITVRDERGGWISSSWVKE